LERFAAWTRNRLVRHDQSDTAHVHPEDRFVAHYLVRSGRSASIDIGSGLDMARTLHLDHNRTRHGEKDRHVERIRIVI
jgi:hypothetical protein